MTETPHLPPRPANSGEAASGEPEEFYTRAYTRMMSCMLIAALVAAPIFFWHPGWQFALGFLLGGALALLNFRWLERTVAGLSDLIIKRNDRPRSGRVVRRFLLRYLLIAAGAYVIFKVSVTAVYGFFTGLSLPVLGILCEAVYELVASFRSQS